MLDQSAEIAENRKLDELLYILTNQNCDNDSDPESFDSNAENSDDDTELASNSSLDRKATSLDGNNTNLSQLMPKISYEEFDIITDCKDAQLKQLLIINRTKHVQLKSLQQTYTLLLNDIEGTLCHYFNLNDTKDSLMRTNKYMLKIGFPYFNLNKFAPPNNADYYRKKESNELNLSYLRHRLRSLMLCGDRIRTSVIYNYYDNKIHHYQNEVNNATKKTSDGNNIEEYTTIVNNMRRRLGNVLDMYADCPDLWDDEFLTWETIADKDYGDHTAGLNIRAIWNYYVHPSINKSAFTDVEDTKIIAFVKAHDTWDATNWKILAELLQTSRSEHQLCVHYASKLKQIENAPTGEISDISLLNIDKMRMRIPWNALTYQVSAQKITKFYNRYKYLQSMKDRKRGNFTLEEDIKIVEFVKQYGQDFQKLSEIMPDRSKLQIKHRFLNSLASDCIVFGNWSIEDDLKIMRHVQEHGGLKWGLLADSMNRNSSQVRHRYKVIRKHLSKGDINAIPRRKHVTSFNGILQQREQLMHFQYKTKGIDIDDQLKQYFIPSTKLHRMRTMKRFTGNQLETCVSATRKLLKLLNVNLKLPENFEINEELDNIDVEILKSLCGETLTFEYSHVLDSSEAEAICQPNLSSVQSLRYLLLHPYNLKTEKYACMSFPKNVVSLIHRFKVMFMWPSLMSTVSPPEIETVILPLPSPPRPLPRPKGRPKKNLSKIHKMLEVKKLRKRGIGANGTPSSTDSVN